VNELRAEIPIAQVAMLIAAPNRDKETHPKPFTIEEFLVVNRKSEAPAAPVDKAKQSDAMLAFVETLNAQFGGADLRFGKVTQSKELISQ
jgi:hypothetical protein